MNLIEAEFFWREVVKDESLVALLSYLEKYLDKESQTAFENQLKQRERQEVACR